MKTKEKMNVISVGEFMITSKTESLNEMKKVANAIMKENKELILEVNRMKKGEEIDLDAPDYVG